MRYHVEFYQDHIIIELHAGMAQEMLATIT